MDKKPLLPTNDYVFKKIFSENMFTLADFLQKVLDLPAEEYKHLEIIDPNLLPANIENKHCILDVGFTRIAERLSILKSKLNIKNQSGSVFSIIIRRCLLNKQ